MWNDALPRNGITNWSVFYAQQNTTTTNGWLSWMKPVGVSWVYFFVIGAGAGGGRPANGATTVGGGGGGSGGIGRVLIPASLLPDIIYVRPAAGGLGATASGGNGSPPAITYVAIAPNTTAQNTIFNLGNSSGGNGSTGAGGAGGGGLGSANGIWLNVGLFTGIGGQAGRDGALLANTNGSGATFGASGLPITSGAGGGNGTGNGGNIVGSGLMPNTFGGSGTTGGNGENGFRMGQTFAPGFKLFPLLFSGGTGGGGHSTGTAGNGGIGSYGCGGGGGGGCSGAGGISGNGGNGGDGLILIGAF